MSGRLKIAVLTKVLQCGQYLKSSENSENFLLIWQNLPILSLPKLSITIEIVNNVTSLIYLYFGNDYVEIIFVLNKKNFNMRLF